MYYNDMNVNRGSENKYSLPPGWRWMKLGEVSRIFAGGAAPQGKDYYNLSGPCFFRISDLGRCGKMMRLGDSRDRLSPKALAECHLVHARSGTVVFPKSGAAIATNNRAILSSDGYIVSHLIGLEPKPSSLSKWLYFAVCQIDMMDFSDNTGYPSLRQSSVERIEIPLPPLSDQKRIAADLNERMEAHELEALILRVVKPVGNKQKGTFARSEDIKRQFRQDIKKSVLKGVDELFTKVEPIPSEPGHTLPEESKPILARYKRAPKKLRAHYKGKFLWASVRRDGKIRFAGKIYDSPSAAGGAACKRK